MTLPVPSPTAGQALGALRATLEGLEMEAVEDREAPRFFIALGPNEGPRELVLELLGSELLCLSATLPRPEEGDAVLPALIFVNEVNRQCRQAALMLDAEAVRLTLRLARPLEGLPQAPGVRHLLHSALFFAVSLNEPTRLLLEQGADWQDALARWEEVRESLPPVRFHASPASSSTPTPAFLTPGRN